MKNLLIGGSNHGSVFESDERMRVIEAPKKSTDEDRYSMPGFVTEPRCEDMETEVYVRQQLALGNDRREYFSLHTMTTREAEQSVWDYIWHTAKNKRED